MLIYSEQSNGGRWAVRLMVAEFKVESLCLGGASDWWKGSSGAAILFTSNAVPTRLQSESYASQSD